MPPRVRLDSSQTGGTPIELCTTTTSDHRLAFLSKVSASVRRVFASAKTSLLGPRTLTFSAGPARLATIRAGPMPIRVEALVVNVSDYRFVRIVFRLGASTECRLNGFGARRLGAARRTWSDDLVHGGSVDAFCRELPQPGV